MFSVNQHWDPLRVCIVGRAHDPDHFSSLTDPTTRSALERVAIESEEDYAKLSRLLESLGVEVLRPNAVSNDRKPPVAPRDYTAMIGDRFFIDLEGRQEEFKDICARVAAEGNEIILDTGTNTASICRLGKDLIFGEVDWEQAADADLRSRMDVTALDQDQRFKMIDMIRDRKKHRMVSEHRQSIETLFPDHRKMVLPDLSGHIDGCFCPIRPGLVIAVDYLRDRVAELFPGWEVIPIPKRDLSDDRDYEKLRRVNLGSWWIPGMEASDDFTDYVMEYLSHWTGYVDETYFDVNTLIVDQQNVICVNFPDHLLKVYDSLGITAHAVDFRHRFFWDGGIHCVTSDLHRIGDQVDLGLINPSKANLLLGQ